MTPEQFMEKYEYYQRHPPITAYDYVQYNKNMYEIPEHIYKNTYEYALLDLHKAQNLLYKSIIISTIIPIKRSFKNKRK